jgi:hypothetical protein
MLGVFLCVGMLATDVFAGGEIYEIRSKENAAGGAGGAGERIDRLLCIDGLKVFQTVVFGVGEGSGASVANMQLYVEQGGKVVPATCEGAKKKK